jgi:hypothetical protein
MNWWGRRTESALTRNESREWWSRFNDGSGQRPSDIHVARLNWRAFY